MVKYWPEFLKNAELGPLQINWLIYEKYVYI